MLVISFFIRIPSILKDNKQESKLQKYLSPLSKFAFFLSLIFIEYLATTPQSFEIVEKSWDKANHFIAFATLYILLSFGYVRLKTSSKFWLLFAFGFQIELVQSFLPFRYFSFFDILANLIGIFIGIILIKIIKNL